MAMLFSARAEEPSSSTTACGVGSSNGALKGEKDATVYGVRRLEEWGCC
jgi:hypothetical protein